MAARKAPRKPMKYQESFVALAYWMATAGLTDEQMAVEFGVTWQKLDKAIRHGLRTQVEGNPHCRIEVVQEATQEVPKATLEAISDPRPLPLTEKYRPRSLDSIFGQERGRRRKRK